MHSDPLDINECAFFIFPNTGQYSFWNKNVNYPIVLSFLDDNFQIKDIGKLKAQQEHNYTPACHDIKYVVELHADFFNKHDVNIGDYMILDGNNIKVISQKKGIKKYK